MNPQLRPAVAATAGSALTPVQHVLGGLMIFLIFGLISRLPEIIAVYVNDQVNFFRGLAVLAVLGTLFTGGFRHVLSSRVNTYLVALTVWFILATPFGVWPGGAARMLAEGWSKAYMFAAASIGLLVTTEHCKKATYAIGLGSIVVGIHSLIVGQEAFGRLIMGAGSLGNPNQLAFNLVIGVPSCILMTRSRSYWVRMLGRAGVVLLLVFAIKTGSRMGVVMLVALALAMILRASALGKLKLILLLAAGITIALVFAPQSVIDRYATLLQDPPEEGELLSPDAAMAQGSTLGRTALAKLAVKVTLQHPILGIGPGLFGVATSADPEMTKRHLTWRETHNAYLEISSEAGIPALLIYLALIGSVLRSTYLLAKRGKSAQATQPTAECLFLTIVAFCAGALFNSIGYLFYFPVLAGCCAALERSARLEAAALTQAKTAVSPRPV